MPESGKGNPAWHFWPEIRSERCDLSLVMRRRLPGLIRAGRLALVRPHLDWGARTRTGPRIQKPAVLPITPPPKRHGERAAGRYYDARVPEPTVVILAAGEGTRMRSAVPKVLHPLCGRPLIAWPVQAARDAGAGRVIVVDNPKRRLEDHLPDGVEVAIQEEPRGTGDAVAAAAVAARPRRPPSWSSTATSRCSPPRRSRAGRGARGGTARRRRWRRWSSTSPGAYGRVIRDGDGSVLRVAEAKGGAGDATAEELEIREVNTGVYAFDGGALVAALATLDSDNAQGELYLPDVLPAMRDAGRMVAAHPIGDPDLTHGVDDRVDLAYAQQVAQRRILEEHMRSGVTIVDPGSTRIDATVTHRPRHRDRAVRPAQGRHRRSAATPSIGAMSTLIDTQVGDGVTILHSHLTQARVDDGATVGPFAYLRPDAHLHPNGQGRHLRGDQELRDRRRHQGPAPLLHRRRRHRRGHQHRRRQHHRQLRRQATSTGRRSARASRPASTPPSSRPSRSATAPTPAPAPWSPLDVPPGALAISRGRQKNIEGYADRKER